MGAVQVSKGFSVLYKGIRRRRSEVRKIGRSEASIERAILAKEVPISKKSAIGLFKVFTVSSPSCAGDNGSGIHVEYSDDFRALLKRLKPEIKPEDLKVDVLKASIKACRIRSESIRCVKHSFVTLELYSAHLPDKFFVTAELNRNGAHGKINVLITPRVLKHVVGEEIEVVLYEKNALMSEVVAVLVNHSSNYNILRDNCYQYADNMFRDVVKRFGIEVVQSGEMKADLQRALDKHPRPVLPKDVLRKRDVAGAVMGSAVTTAGVATAAVAY